MTQQDINTKYDELISSYMEIKPVLTDLYQRNGNHHIDGILNEIRALNDHVARCYRDDMEIDAAYNELCKAEGHLKRLIYDCFKQLNILFYDFAADYETKYFDSHWLCFDNGEFWRKYTSKRKEITSNVEQAKIHESSNSEKTFEFFQNAYVLQGEVYDLLEEHKEALQLSRVKSYWQKINSLKGWVLSTIALAVIPALIWEVYTHWSSLIIWLNDNMTNLIHWVGKSLQAW